MNDRLFNIDDTPEIPIFREAKRAGAAGWSDDRFKNDYPPSWTRCETCDGDGEVIPPEDIQVTEFFPDVKKVEVKHLPSGLTVQAEGRSRLQALVEAMRMLRWRIRYVAPECLCPDCKGMGSIKAMVRLDAGHRCVRCLHPYMPKGDAKVLGVEPSGVGGEHMGGRWSACDERCEHGEPTRFLRDGEWVESNVQAIVVPSVGGEFAVGAVEAEWRILTVHHLDGDKANCRWWNLAALCQRCHLEIQGKVIMERTYPWPHSKWFRPYVAGYYAFVYLGEELTRPEVEERMDELLGLELAVG